MRGVVGGSGALASMMRAMARAPPWTRRRFVVEGLLELCLHLCLLASVWQPGK